MRARVMKCIKTFLSEEAGATATEYAVMIALVLLVVIAAVAALGSQVSSSFSDAEQGW